MVTSATPISATPQTDFTIEHIPNRLSHLVCLKLPVTVTGERTGSHFEETSNNGLSALQVWGLVVLQLYLPYRVESKALTLDV